MDRSRRPLSVTSAPAGSIREFYQDRRNLIGLLICSVILTYGGGAMLFWFHSIYLREGGPAISPWYHWLLDSTAGFVGLSPVIALIVPRAARVATRSSGAHTAPRTRPAWFAAWGGGLLALVTAPAPLLHDRFLARDTWVADKVTRLLGNGHQPSGEPQDVSAVVEMSQQVLAGMVIYIPLMGLAFFVVRGLARFGWTGDLASDTGK